MIKKDITTYRKHNKGFAIIEILVGIFIFSLGLVSIYAIIVSILRVNEYNKNYIIATNIAREQIELFRNIRDSNYKIIKKYNQINPSNDEYNVVFEPNNYYKIENDYNSLSFPIKVENITSGFEEGKDKLNGSSMNNYKLCLDSDNRYTHDCSTPNIETFLYKYLQIEEVEDVNGVIDDALKLKSKVIWYKKGYHEFEINTVITDWKRL